MKKKVGKDVTADKVMEGAVYAFKKLCRNNKNGRCMLAGKDYARRCFDCFFVLEFKRRLKEGCMV